MHQALQQRFQLAIQQSYSIGNFLAACIDKHRSLTGNQDLEGERQRGRPRVASLLDILDGIDQLATSSSCLQDQILLFQTVCHFPMLFFVNEPMSHLVNGDVRAAVSCLADKIHSQCRAPDNMHESYIKGCPYTSTVNTNQSPQLSDPIDYGTVTPNDGDGLITKINRSNDNPLEGAVWVRLHGIDAPEISSSHFFKTDDLSHVFVKRMGHLSLCGLHFFLRLFLLEGNAEFCEELPDMESEPPVDSYSRPLKQYWFRFSSPEVTQWEEQFLNYLELLVGGESQMRERVMSPFSISEASSSKNFLISLNALLVVTGFCHVFTKHSQDNRLLALQAVAKAKKVGPLWCGPTRSYIYGAQSNTSEDVVLRHFTPETTQNARKNYNVETILPWHERRAAKKLCSDKATRSEVNENLTKALVDREPYSGMFIDITRQVFVQHVNLSWLEAICYV